MGLRKEIQDKANEILNNNFYVDEVDYVPQLKDLSFGNSGFKFKGAVLYIDMRGSTKILNKHNRTTVAKLHMCFFHTIVKIANSMGGNVRSFNGDSALIFFVGDKDIISTAVKCAMKIKFMLNNEDNGINKQMNKYSSINFGIGVDYGQILCTKVGIGGEHNRDLFWIGNSVNKSTILGDRSTSPQHISISKFVFENLTDNLKWGQKLNWLDNKVKFPLWEEDEFRYNGEDEICYKTGACFSVY